MGRAFHLARFFAHVLSRALAPRSIHSALVPRSCAALRCLVPLSLRAACTRDERAKASMTATGGGLCRCVCVDCAESRVGRVRINGLPQWGRKKILGWSSLSARRAPEMSDAALARFRCRCGRRSVHCRCATRYSRDGHGGPIRQDAGGGSSESECGGVAGYCGRSRYPFCGGYGCLLFQPFRSSSHRHPIRKDITYIQRQLQIRIGERSGRDHHHKSD